MYGPHDVYWCHIANDPTFLVWDGPARLPENKPTCPLCKWQDDEYDPKTWIAGEKFRSMHSYASTITKPRPS